MAVSLDSTYQLQIRKSTSKKPRRRWSRWAIQYTKMLKLNKKGLRFELLIETVKKDEEYFKCNRDDKKTNVEN